jgi:hypothetical protein
MSVQGAVKLHVCKLLVCKEMSSCSGKKKMRELDSIAVEGGAKFASMVSGSGPLRDPLNPRDRAPHLR